jgi:acetyl/propionyl-CoA carboxylase alpha subunit
VTSSNERILIVGPSELAKRVERTCRRLGVEPHMFDVRESKNPALPDTESIVSAAKEAAATAVHPGRLAPRARAELGMLAREAGLAFIGPSNEALACLADKTVLRERAESAGLRVIEGSEPLDDAGAAVEAAQRIGYPVMVKPVAGADGIGVRRCLDDDDLRSAFDASAEEAALAHGDRRLFVERALDRPRQLEITVLADGSGSRAALIERECSVQRKNRVVLAETPSPYVLALPDGESLRELLVDLVLRIASELALVGVVTVELLVDIDGRLHFLEANADAHASSLTTELLSGIDVHELSYLLATGAAVTNEFRLLVHGHAFEARLAAEDPDDAFRPKPGVVDEMRFPPAPHGRVRVEAAVELGEEVSNGIEPLVARIGTFGPVRHDALLSLDRTLAECSVGPVPTNAAFLRRVLGAETFRAGQYDLDLTNQVVANLAI